VSHDEKQLPRTPAPGGAPVRHPRQGSLRAGAHPGGHRLIEYTGERITQEEGDRRYPWDDAVSYHTLLFTVEDDLLVEGGVGGNLSRWINHSCDPNCTSTIEDRRIYIESLRDIAPGEELTFDYQMISQNRHTPAEKRRFPCRCGAPGCRGTLLKKKR
jgi:SET domain-containing protein